MNVNAFWRDAFKCWLHMLHIQSEEWIVTLAIQWESQAASERSPVSGLIKSQI